MPSLPLLESELIETQPVLPLVKIEFSGSSAELVGRGRRTWTAISLPVMRSYG